ncbi:MAG: S-layer homology domain-containing protein [Clostridia bacterium]|jgi:outer membrane protein assembly factor BamE (lipoprotein component of BamABCDE complex)|nr:S-layer homology domain-containing protein [Clostridia bacterium]MCI1999038.1 S-layer homology domain-containing protein [Clostridia bacterium]MCI2013788.1 S-layer homology domain-containing protein [Clostridia bacterium]
MKLKKLIAVFSASAIAMGSISIPVFAADFSDINDVPWEGAKTYISAVANDGLMVGDYDDSGRKVFRARDKVNYCETMQLVYELMKNYSGSAISSDIVTKYTTVMNGYGIPEWAHEAVAYGLENKIVTISDIPYFMSKGKGVSATRQDVVLMIGRAISSLDSVNSNPTLTYADASSVSSVAAPYVDLLTRLKIVSGDTDGNFTPKAYINRAEMSVLVSKTYDYLKSKKQNNTNTNTNTTPTSNTKSGSVTGVVTANENVGNNVVLSVNTSSGTVNYMGSASTQVLNGSTLTNLSSVSVGDTVLISYEGQNIKSVLITSSKYSPSPSSSTSSTVKGTFSSISRSEIKIKEDGTKRTYDFDNVDDVKFYYDGTLLSSYSKFDDKADSGDSVTLTLYGKDKDYVIRVDCNSDSNGDDDVDYDKKGYFSAITSSYIKLKSSTSSSSTSKYAYEDDDYDNVTFYVKGSEKTYSSFKSAVSTNDKIGLVYGSDDEVKKVYLISYDDDDDDDDDYDKTGYYSGISDEYIKLKKKTSSSDYDKYHFEDDDIDNVTFYVHGSKKSESTFKDDVSTNDKIGVTYNSDDEVTKVYLIDDDDDSDHKTLYYDSMSSTYMKLKSSKSGSTKKYYYEDDDSDNVRFYIDSSSKTYSRFSDDVHDDDKLKVYFNDDDEITKVYLVDSDDDDDDYKNLYFDSMSSSYMKLKSSKSGSTKKYYYEDDDSDNVKFYIDSSSKTYSTFSRKVDEDDKLKVYFNDDDEITKVYYGSSSDDTNGEISSISSSRLKLKDDSSSYRIDDDKLDDVDVTDGKSSIDRFNDLDDAINDDSKTVKATIKYNDDYYVTSIDGYVSKATGNVYSASDSSDTITIKFSSGEKTTYKVDSDCDFNLSYYRNSLDGIEKAVDEENIGDREITIKVDDDGHVTNIESSEI